MSDHAGVNAFAVDDFGIDFSRSGDVTDFEVFAETFLDAVRAKNRSQFVIGDLFAFSDQQPYEQSIEDVLMPSDLSLGTVRNYASVCKAWHKSLRIVPVSFSHFAATSKLVKVDPVAAMRLLEQAKDHGLDRNWIRDESAKALNEFVERVQLSLVYDKAKGGFFCQEPLPEWIEQGYVITRTVKRPQEKIA